MQPPPKPHPDPAPQAQPSHPAQPAPRGRGQQLLAQLAALAVLGAVRLLTGAQARWLGLPPAAGQRIYFANHQSHFDFLMIWAALPRRLRRVTRPVAARDYWCASALKRWISGAVFNAIYIERGGAAALAAQGAHAGHTGGDAGSAPAVKGVNAVAVDAPTGAGTTQPLSRATAEAASSNPPPSPAPHALLAPLAPLEAALAAGESIILFPEGTRGSTGVPQPFKSGLYTLAERHPDVALVPTWLHNIQRVMPKGEVLPVPILCSVTFGAPLALAPGEDRHAFLERARAAVLALADA